MASDLRGFARGFFAVVAPTCGIFFASRATIPIGLALGINDLANIGFGIALMWVYLCFPYLAAIPEIFFGTAGLQFGLLHWVLVGTVVGGFTRGMSRWRALAWAIFAVIVVSVLTHALLRGLGYAVIVEGP